MRELLKRSLAVLLACAVVSAGVLGAISYTDRNVSPVQEAEACGGLCVGAAVVGGAVVGGVAGGGLGYVLGRQSADDVEQDPIDNLSSQEINETRLNIYEGLTTAEQNAEVQNTTLHNYLEDTEAVALTRGKNEFIKEINNGSTTSTARQEAKQRITEYYAKRELQLIASWELQTAQIDKSFHTMWDGQMNDSDPAFKLYYSSSDMEFQNWLDHSYVSYDVVLANGTTHTTKMLTAEVQTKRHSTASTTTGWHDFKIDRRWNDSSPEDGNHSYLNDGDFQRQPQFRSNPPDHLTSDSVTMSLAQYPDKWHQIEQQSADAQAALDTFVDATETEIKNGAVDTADLVDPMIAKDYAPESAEGTTYALASATSAGIEVPDNLSYTDHMTVDVGGTEYQGFVLSDTPPADGSFEIGTSYNTTNLAGEKYLLNSEGMQPMRKTDFTIKSLNQTDDTVMGNGSVEYTSRDYRTTNTTKYLQIMDEIQQTQAEIDARQEKLFNSGGGSGLLAGLGLGGGGGLVAVLVVGGVVLLMMQGGSGGPTRPRKRRRN